MRHTIGSTITDLSVQCLAGTEKRQKEPNRVISLAVAARLERVTVVFSSLGHVGPKQMYRPSKNFLS